MNKNEINRLLSVAYDVLKQTEIANEKNQIKKTYRGYISTFGAAVSGGSLLAAIAFYSEQGSADLDRPKLMKALYMLTSGSDEDPKKMESDVFFRYIREKILKENTTDTDVYKEAIWKEKTINAAIALKLAMNLYQLEKDEET